MIDADNLIPVGKDAVGVVVLAGYRVRSAHFCRAAHLAEGHWVSTVEKDEATVREYIQEQEKEDQRLNQVEMFKDYSPALPT